MTTNWTKSLQNLCLIARYKHKGTQGDGSLVIMGAKKRGEIHLAFAMYRSKYAVFRQKFSPEIARKPSVYKGLSHFCVIITRASIRRTIPVAFIYKSISLF